MAFFGGSAGAIYRQFSITIVSAMGLSVVVALVLTPALFATLLKPVGKGHGLTRRGPFGWFNRGFDAFCGWYPGGVRRSRPPPRPSGAVHLAIGGGRAWPVPHD